VELRSFGNVGRGRGKETPVSHDSQRGSKMGCVKRMIYVKRVSGSAWDKGLEGTSYAQGGVLEKL
jgi:hypothetical protein